MMFQMTVEVLRASGRPVRVFDLSEVDARSGARASGRVSASRLRQYLLLIPRIWLSALVCSGRTFYLTTAQSLPGFLRDMAIIWPLTLMGHSIVCHQFGANYAAFYCAQGRLVRALIAKTLGRAAAVVVEGESVREHFSFLTGWQDKVRAVVNGLPENCAGLPSTPKSYASGEPFRLLYLSNMIESKGYWDVLKSVEILVGARRRDVSCRFVGRFLTAVDSRRFPDPKEARYAFFRYVGEHGLEERVSYAEELFGEKKAAVFDWAHVFLLPTYYVIEGQPVSVLEAMAHGAVTLATSHRLIPLMVEDGHTGFFVPAGDPQSIADRVERLMDDPDLFERLSRNSIDRFRERFSRQSYAARLSIVLDEFGL